MRGALAGLALAAVSLCGACKGKRGGGADSAESAPPWASAAPKVVPKPGMVWIPPGVLEAGTPLDRAPRVPDAELPGDRMEMSGFYIDEYPHPNEPGAIPTTGLSREAASELCAAAGKRLCTELEIERACKGPDNLAYPYGNEYKADVCGTGKRGDSLTPNGFHAGCVSGFGVHDTHGSVWFWTSSEYARGTQGLGALKGGNSPHGELVGRCANVKGDKPTVAASSTGVRCCLGPPNLAHVELAVKREKSLVYRREDTALARRFEEQIATLPDLVEGKIDRHPSDAGGPLPKAFRVERTWTWHPLGNEEMHIAGGCAQGAKGKVCGAFVGRAGGEGGPIRLLVFVASDRWQPTLSEGDEARVLYVQGGDDYGAFRKAVTWDWGKVGIFNKERRKGQRTWVATP